nr:non capsid protein NS 1 [Hymenolepis microstoma]
MFFQQVYEVIFVIHVLIQSRENFGRKVDRLFNDCLVTAEDWWLIKNTRILVRNVYLIIQCFKHREPNAPCTSDIRRAQTKSVFAQCAETRLAKFGNLLKELMKRDTRQFKDIFQKFSVQKIAKMNSSMGVQWREFAKQQILGLNSERLAAERQNTYLDNLQSLKHECFIKSVRDIDLGTSWLMMLLNENHINTEELLRDIINIIIKKTTKVNALCLKGQSNTGKTLLANLITSHLTFERAEIPGTTSGAGYERPSSPSFIGHDPFGIEEGQQLLPSTQRLGDVGSRTQNTLSSGMAEKDSSVDNILPTERIPQSFERCYHTLIITNYSKVPTSISCIYVEHDSHMHKCQARSDNEINLGTNWLTLMLNQNGIDIYELLNDIIAIMEKKTTKANTLCFKSQTNTGKTLLANLITSHLTVGTVCRRGDQTAFHFDNLLNRTAALMEEPRITMTTKNDYKCLFGGDRFEIDVKYGARRFLQRIPVVDTTNEDLGALLALVDRAALYSRVKQYNLNEQISSELISETIEKCPLTLCACHLRELFKRYAFYGDPVQRIEISKNMDFLSDTTTYG